MITCKYCNNQRPDSGNCPHCGSPVLPADYETCGECGHDHSYEYEKAHKWHSEHTMTYKVIRKYVEGHEDEEVKTGITLEEAKAHCNDPESSSRTCTSKEGQERTEAHGPWMDVWYEEA